MQTSFVVATEADLNAALQQIDIGGLSSTTSINYTITFAAQSGTLALTTDLDAINLAAKSTVTFNGAGETLDGGGTQRGFLVYSGNIAINDLTIAHATATGGAGGAGYQGSGGRGGGGAGLGGALMLTGYAGGTPWGSQTVILSNVSFYADSAVGGAGGPGLAGFGIGGGGGGLGGAGGSSTKSYGGGGGGVGSSAFGGGTTAGGAGIMPGAPSGGGGGYPGGPNGGGGGAGAAGGGGGVGGYSSTAAKGTFGSTYLKGGYGGFGGGGGGSGLYGTLAGTNSGRSHSGMGGFGGGGGGGWRGGFGGGWRGVDGEQTAPGQLGIAALHTNAYGGFGSYQGGGGGGAALGGAVFIASRATLIVQGAATFTGGSVSSGAGGVSFGGTAGDSGIAEGAGLFLQSEGVVAFSPGIGKSLTIDDPIIKIFSSGSVSSGAGTVVLNAANTFASGFTVLGGGTAILNAPNTFGAGVSVSGTLRLNAANTFPAGGGVTINSGSTLDLGANNADGNGVAFAGSGITLRLEHGVTETRPIAGFAALDAFDFVGIGNGTNPATVQFKALSDQLTVSGTTGGTATIDLGVGAYNPAFFVASLDPGGSGTTVTYACFTRGTQIATPVGMVAVDDLVEGQMVVTESGRLAPVVWIGQRSIDCLKHPRKKDVLPVRIRASAFDDGIPCRDLLLSPDHAVFIDDVLIPIRCLINDRTIVQENVASVAYYHVELDRHDVILAEGLPCESYLDTGNRSAFANGDGLVQMHPNFALRAWETKSCAFLMVSGHTLEDIKTRLLARAEDRGFCPTAGRAIYKIAEFGEP